MPCAAAGSDFLRVDVNMPAQTGGQAQAADVGEPAGKESLQRGAGGGFEEELRAFASGKTCQSQGDNAVQGNLAGGEFGGGGLREFARFLQKGGDGGQLGASA